MKNPFRNGSRPKRILAYVSATLLGLVLLLFLFRNPLFRWALNAQIERFEKESGLDVSIEHASLRGFQRCEFENISILSGTDSLLHLSNLEVAFRPWKLISRKHLLSEIRLQSGFVRYRRTKKAIASPKEEKRESRDLSTLPSRLYRLYQTYFPSRFFLADLDLEYQDSLGSVHVRLDRIEAVDKAILGKVVFEDPTARQTWHMRGSMEKGLLIETYPESRGPLPVLYQRFGFDFRSDTLRLHLRSSELKGDGLHVELEAGCRGLAVFHPRLSTDTIEVARLQSTMNLRAADGLLYADSTSTFDLNAIHGTFGCAFPLSASVKKYGLLIHTSDVPSTDFFASLPKGTFDDTRGIKAKGTLSYQLRFWLDGENPDAVVFESALKKNGFRIEQYGATNLSLMSGSFTHSVYENERPYRSFQVGPENPSFTPYAVVPSNLVHAILVSEDPSFFYHGGFIQESFRESIAENYRTKSFKRGGSTISMQLVKNVFLSRKKTVFRKIEEALIVWLIEGQRLTSKERMMEVYLNIIEWGPGVYGVAEASRFYFNKPPQQLTLPECIYLANIIPRPKKFKYSFDEQGNMRSYMLDLHLFILRRMATKEYLSVADTAGYVPRLELKGPARDLVIPVDSIPADSLLLDAEPDF